MSASTAVIDVKMDGDADTEEKAENAGGPEEEAEDDQHIDENEEEEIEETPEMFSVQHLRLCKHTFDKLVKDHSTAIGKAISKRQRESEKLRGVHFAYAEIRFESFAILLKKCQSKHGGLEKPGGVFYDLGSGLGKAVFAALMVFQFERCTGIEKLDALHDGAREIADKWDRTKDGYSFLTEGQRQTEVDLLNDDFLNEHVSWEDARMVYMNSTCYGEDIMLKIAGKCEKMQPLTWVITHTKRLPSVHFDVLEECRMMQSWCVNNFLQIHNNFNFSKICFALTLLTLACVDSTGFLVVGVRFDFPGVSAQCSSIGKSQRTGKRCACSEREKSAKRSEWKKK